MLHFIRILCWLISFFMFVDVYIYEHEKTVMITEHDPSVREMVFQVAGRVQKFRFFSRIGPL